MSDICIYIELDDYLKQWYLNENNNEIPIRPQRGSAESDILEIFLRKQPLDKAPDIQHAGDGRLPIALPSFKARDPRTYNYLAPRAKHLLQKAIYTRFRVQLWEEMHKLEHVGVPITELIYAFLEKHGIEPNEKNFFAVQQMYYRKRNVYSRQYKKKKLSN